MKKLSSLILALMACVTFAKAEVITGTCGSNLTWSLNTETKILTIEGSGNMNSAGYLGASPWYASREEIETVILPEGITSIGNSMFYGCYNMRTINLPQSITAIYSLAFAECYSLTSVTLPDSLSTLGNASFERCYNLSSIVIPKKIKRIYPEVFMQCMGLTSVVLPEDVTQIDWNAFSWCTSLTSIFVPNTVTTVDMSAFNYVPNVEYEGSVAYAPWGARSLNGWVDRGMVYSDNTKTTLLACPSVTNTPVTIPSSVKTIGDGAFMECQQLPSVTLPEGLEHIGNEAFRMCSVLVSLHIPESVKSIGNDAFVWCKEITSITIPDSATTLGDNLFGACLSLRDIHLPSGLTAISNYMFNGCPIRTIELPQSIATIGEQAFAYCDSLETITLPASVSMIKGMAFAGCSNLTQLTCEAITPPVLNSMDINDIFNGVDKFTCILYVPAESIDLYRAADGWRDFMNILPIPGTEPCVTDTTVLDIISCYSYQFKGEWLEESGIYYDTLVNFRGCDSIVELHLTIASSYGGGWPSDLMDTITIERGESVIISRGYPWQHAVYPTETDYYNDTLRTIYGCDSIVTHYIIVSEPICRIASGTCGTNLTWELTCDSVLTISGTGAMTNWSSASSVPWYSYRNAIKAVNLPEGLTTIGNYAFYNCTLLTSIDIPNSVTGIGGSTFSGCKGLISVELPEGLTSIGGSAFYGCSGLTEITIPHNVKSIGKDAFVSCLNLSRVTINSNALLNATYNLDSRNSPGWVFGENPFEIVLGDSVKCIGAYSLWYSPMTKITIPNSVVRIKQLGFGTCKNLKSVTLPDSIKSIDSEAFIYSWNLAFVHFGKSIQSVGSRAFQSCSVKTVEITNPIPPDSVKVCNCSIYPANCELLVPEENLEAYKNAPWWRNFLYINAIGGDHTVIFKDWNGNVLSRVQVPEGGSAVDLAPAAPEVEHNVFIGWSQYLSNITESMTVYAQYEPIKVLVQFVDWDGTVLKSDSVYYQGWVEAPENPYRPGYAFTGWDRDFGYESLISDLVITAQYMQLDPGAVTITDGGAVNALFSVGEGKQVLFSRGNLQFNAAQGSHACADGTTQPGTWRFAGEQYSVRTWDNYNRCETCDNWIDLFYYGTSGYNGVMPYRDDMDVETLQQVGNVEGTNYDFGVYNAISNGGNTPGGWRLFTRQEWEYLIKNRPHAYKLYNIVKINDIYGVVILPDNSDTTLLRQEINPEEYYYPYYAPSYSLNEWRQLEAKGAIFLPGGGMGRKVNGYFNIYSANEQGYYMVPYTPSSTYNSMSGIGFDSTTVWTGLTMNSSAISVRLVQDVDVFHLNAVSNNSAWGTVNGDSLYWNEAISMTATPNEGYHFVQWSDGVTDNPRTISLTADSTITAEFAPNIYSLTVTCDAEQGTINGKSGSFDYLSEHTFEAVANPGFTFLTWSDGVKDNPRTIVLTHDSTITALFELGEYTDFIVNFNTQEGEVILSNSVVLKVPNAPEITGFTFIGWRPVATIIENNTIDIEAVYTYDGVITSAPAEYTNPANPAQKLIRNGNVYILYDGKTYTMQGQKVTLE